MIGVIGMIAGSVAVIAGLLYFFSSVEKKRSQELEGIARELDMEFAGAADDALVTKLQQCVLFTKGRRRIAKNVMSARSTSDRGGAEWTAIFDYQYTVGGGQQSHTHRHSVLAIESSALRAPNFTLQPEGLFAKIGAAFGSQDIDYEDDPEFSRLFVLKGEDEAAVRDFFGAKLRSNFRQRKGVTVAVAGGTLYFFRGQRREKPEALRSLISDGLDVFEAVRARSNATQS